MHQILSIITVTAVKCFCKITTGFSLIFLIHGRKIFLEDDSFNFVSFVCPKEMILAYFYIISQFFYSCNLMMRSLEGTIIVREVIKWQNNNKFHINPENTY